MQPLIAAGAVVIILFVVFISSFQKERNIPRGAKHPLGPKGKLVVGNLFEIPAKHSWLTFQSWANQYGPIYRLSIFARNIVVVSTEKIANDLLRERGNLYSSREQLPMAAKLMSRDLRPLLLPYGGMDEAESASSLILTATELWRRGRKVMHAMTMQTAATSYQPVQIHESEQLLYDLIKAPERYEQLFERYSGAIIMRIAYGKAIKTGDEPYVQKVLKVVHTVERVASPGAYLVDTFPILMYLPEWLAPFKREAAQLHDFEITLFRDLLFEVRDKIKAEKCPRCFSRTFLERQSEFGLTDDQGAYVIGTLFEAGAGTTAAAMMSFVLAMCHYPQWQEKIQQEVDQVVGETDRMPDFTDIPALPTVRAVAKEVLRWRPVTAGGVPHELIRDDVYEGYFIPAGTNIHPNQW